MGAILFRTLDPVMQSKLAKALRNQFETELKRNVPAFLEDKESELPPGWRSYRLNVAPGLTLFIALCLSPKDDRFTVELGWSEIGRLPAAGAFGPTDPPKGGGLTFRLSALWHPQRHDYWWVLGRQRTLEEMANFVPDQPAEEKLPDVAPKVADAIEKIVMFGLPYFEMIAAEKGVSVEFKRGVAPKQDR